MTVTYMYESPSSRRPKFNSASVKLGFTLMELLVVLAIIALALALVPPFMPNAMNSMKVRSAARQLAAGLRNARDLAVTSQQETRLVLDVNAHEFAVGKRKTHLTLPSSATLNLDTATVEQQSRTAGSIRFFPDGSATGGRITLAYQKSQYQIDVNWLTGLVSVTP